MGDPISQFFAFKSATKKPKPKPPGPPPRDEKKEREEEEQRKIRIGRSALVQTSPQGILNPASTGRRTLTGS